MNLLEKFAQDTPEALKNQWEKVYNNALKTYDGDEARAAATAWASVKKKYKKDSEGKWVAKESMDENLLNPIYSESILKEILGS